MKALIISDIHSNIYALEAIWEKENDSDVVYCAGDLVDYGPFPKEVIQWIREHDVPCVRGNHDEYIVSIYRKGRTNLKDIPVNERTWADDNASQLDEEDIRFLDLLPEHIKFELDGISYCMQHKFDGYQTIEARYQFDQFWEERVAASGNEYENDQRRIIFGHTHYQAIHYVSNKSLWLNPGSASYRPTRQAIDFSQAAQYMTIVDGIIRMHHLEYDLTPLFTALQTKELQKNQMDVGYRFFKRR